MKNKVQYYICPTSGRRVIQSNSIPDHSIKQGNDNIPCERLTYVDLPLQPTKSARRTEAPPIGIIGIATNGVHLFGAQEAAGGNAIDHNGTFKDARFWYGHATQSKVAHYHNPSAGHDPGTSPAGEDELIGWALDGYGIYGFTDKELDECNGREGPGGYQYHVRHPDKWNAMECWDEEVAPDYCSDNETLAGASFLLVAGHLAICCRWVCDFMKA